MRKTDIKNERYIVIALAISILAAGCYFEGLAVMSQRSTDSLLFGKFNMDVYGYILGILLFSGLMFLLVKVSCFCKSGDLYIKIIQIGMPVIVLGWNIAHYFMENSEFASYTSYYLRHDSVFSKFYGLYVVLVCLVICHLEITVPEKSIFNVRMGIGAVCSVLTALLLYCPNSVGDSLGTISHIHAYDTSIINTVDLQAYSSVNYSIYGHYGLFYIIPVTLLKWMGVNPYFAIIMCISAVGGGTVACSLYTLNRMVKNDKVFILSAFTLVLLATQIFERGQYYQTFPHRMFFSALVAAFVLYLKEKIFFRRFFLAVHFFCCLAILWNLETGMVCTAGVVSYLCLFKIREKKEIILYVLKGLLMMVADFFLAYLIVNGYNVVVGGGLNSLKDFIYPLMSDNYVIDTILWAPLGHISNLWFLEVVFLITGVALAVLWGFGLVEPERKNFCDSVFPGVFLVSVTGLGLLVYFITRSAALGATISYMQFVIVLGVFCDCMLQKYHNGKEKLMRNLYKETFLVLECFLAVGAVTALACSGKALEMRKAQAWNTGIVMEICGKVKETVPVNTMGIGAGILEISTVLGWEQKVYTVDHGDALVDLEAQRLLLDTALEQDVLLMNMPYIQWDVSEITENFECVGQIDGTTFEVYQKKSCD